MAYDPPTYAEFIARFPVFDNVAKWPQATVEAIIVEATNNIDTDWIERDYKPAIMYQTAHILSSEAAADADAPDAPGPATYLASESFSGMSMSYAKISQNGTLSQSETWGGTSYGRRYLDLLRKNKPAVVVA